MDSKKVHADYSLIKPSEDLRSQAIALFTRITGEHPTSQQLKELEDEISKE